MQNIRIRGARTHNLKNIDLDLPRDRLIVLTGLSGSGKSSLAFDTIYAEGQRRYVESLSTYARQFLSMMEKPDVDTIEGLSPAISIEQKSTSHNPRSTVGTVTEIYDYLRLLYARAGTPRCPDHQIDLAAQTVSQMVDAVLQHPEGTALMLLAPAIAERKGEHAELIEELQAGGFVRARIDGRVVELDQAPKLDVRRKHTVEAIVDRFKVRPDLGQRLAESFETALRLGQGVARIAYMDDPAASGTRVLGQIRLSHLQLFVERAGAAAVLLQQPDRRLSHLRRTGHPGILRSGENRRESASVARRRRGARLGPAQRLLLSVDSIAGAARQVRHRSAVRNLPQKIKDLVLFGSADEQIEFKYLDGKGGTVKRRHTFEGIVRNLERRYNETESVAVREELAKYRSSRACPDCLGTRLNRAARNVFVDGMSVPEVSALSVASALEFFGKLKLPGWRGEIAVKIVKEIGDRLGFLGNVGLGYLTLNRSADTLSGGEAQRIRLASQIGSGLVGVMYILDEPSIGLHQRDNQRLLDTLANLRDLGNTVIVVEHDEDAIRQADHVVDLGPGAGVHGGAVVAQGTAAEVAAHPDSITGQYLSGRRRIEIPVLRRTPDPKRLLRVVGATANNLKKVTAEFPLGLMTCVTGVSGSGKSTLINDTLFRAVATQLNHAAAGTAHFDRIEGLDYIDRVIEIDQSPIGRTPRSNPATYTGLFAPIREIFAAVPESRARGYEAGRFSFNVKGGRCEACQGDGVIKVEMHFLADVYVPCDVCKGKRYNRETLEIRFKGKNIQEILDLTVEDALPFFSAVPTVQPKLQTLLDVGLSYVRLGQSATTLSGGEAQRVKLAKELSKRATGRTLYILDEPTTGLHFADIAQLLVVLQRLRDEGNTVIVIEHNLDVIKTADWVVDLGPEGGDGGGRIIAVGTPEQIAAHKTSYTGRYLRAKLAPLRIERKRA